MKLRRIWTDKSARRYNDLMFPYCLGSIHPRQLAELQRLEARKDIWLRHTHRGYYRKLERASRMRHEFVESIFNELNRLTE